MRALSKLQITFVLSCAALFLHAHDGYTDNNQRKANSTPYPSVSATAQPQSNYQTQQTAQESTDWRDIAFGPSTWSNWALTIVAGIAAYLAVRTLRSIDRQADIADKALIVAREPHLVATNFRLGGIAVGNVRTPTVIYDLKNYGLGPAFVDYLTVICEVKDALKQPPSYLGASIQVSTLGKVIGPNEAIEDISTVCNDSLDDPPDASLGESEYKLLLGGLTEQHLFLYGYVLYNDIFQRGHVRGFAAIWDRDRGIRLTSAYEAQGYNYGYAIKRWKRAPLWVRSARRLRRLFQSNQEGSHHPPPS